MSLYDKKILESAMAVDVLFQSLHSWSKKYVTLGVLFYSFLDINLSRDFLLNEHIPNGILSVHPYPSISSVISPE